METFNLELYPHRQAHIALFQNVQNASELLQRISAQDKDLTCTLLKPTYIINIPHILLAVNRAVAAEENGKLETHGLYSDIHSNFGTTNNRAKVYKTFGIAQDSTHIIAVYASGTPEQAEEYLKQNIQGDIVPLSQLTELRDLKEIEKYYGLKNLDGDESKIFPLVAGAMALRDNL